MSKPAEWRALLEAFAGGRMSAPDFERAFLHAWRQDRDNGLGTVGAIETLFYEVDAYCADPALRGPHDIDEAALLAATSEALAHLDQPTPNPPGDAADLRQLDAISSAVMKLSF